MGCKVVHCLKHDYDIYIGRGKCRKTGMYSKWKNPFPINKNNDREKVVKDYKEWILTQPKLLNSLHELYNKTLGCWCKQEPDNDTLCHGDILKELVEKHVQFYDDIGITQDIFCGICCSVIDKTDSSGIIYCSKGHMYAKVKTD